MTGARKELVHPGLASDSRPVHLVPVGTQACIERFDASIETIECPGRLLDGFVALIRRIGPERVHQFPRILSHLIRGGLFIGGVRVDHGGQPKDRDEGDGQGPTDHGCMFHVYPLSMCAKVREIIRRHGRPGKRTVMFL